LRGDVGRREEIKRYWGLQEGGDQEVLGLAGGKRSGGACSVMSRVGPGDMYADLAIFQGL